MAGHRLFEPLTERTIDDVRALVASRLPADARPEYKEDLHQVARNCTANGHQGAAYQLPPRELGRVWMARASRIVPITSAPTSAMRVALRPALWNDSEKP
jgi:hypothetical protein